MLYIYNEIMFFFLISDLFVKIRLRWDKLMKKITREMLFMALLQRFSFILLFATLVGCGGSSGGFDETPDGGDGSTPDAITITLAISNTTVTGAAPVTVVSDIAKEIVIASGVVPSPPSGVSSNPPLLPPQPTKVANSKIKLKR